MGFHHQRNCTVLDTHVILTLSYRKPRLQLWRSTKEKLALVSSLLKLMWLSTNEQGILHFKMYQYDLIGEKSFSYT